MKQKPSAEFENFDKVMDGLLAVPYSELQKELAKEERAKAKKKEAAYFDRFFPRFFVTDKARSLVRRALIGKVFSG